MSKVPILPKPNKDTIYMRFVDQSWNCKSCPQGQGKPPWSIVGHITWIFQAVSALQKGDVCMFGGDFQFFDDDKDNPYYSGGFQQALLDAMSRGAYVIHILDRFYVGGRDQYGNCQDCPHISGKPDPSNGPFGCGDPNDPNDPSRYNRGIPSLYGGACWIENGTAMILYNAYPNNYIMYNVPNYEYIDEIEYHSHCKLISFYMPSQSICSVFKGSWNVSTSGHGNWMKETGFGITANLNGDWGRCHLYRDYSLLKLLETKYSDKKKFPGFQMSSSNMLMNILTKFGGPPKSPTVTVKNVYFGGPDYCDSEYSCGAPGSKWQCSRNEKYVSGYDENVTFSFGVDPDPKISGWNPFFPYGFDLLTQMMTSSKKFLKTSIHGQCLELSEGDATVGFFDAVQKTLNGGAVWFCLENDRNFDWGGNNLFSQLSSNTNFYAKKFGICGKASRGNISEPEAVTHDKLWINEHSFLLSSAHPASAHYEHIINEDLWIQNCPSLLNYVNNHFNFFWNNCGLPVSTAGSKYTNSLGDMTCTDPKYNQKGCCIAPDTVSQVKVGFGEICPDGTCAVGPCAGISCEHGNCDNGKCVCDKGWEGKQCDQMSCDGVDCGQHGRCSKGKCICDKGWEGQHCEKDKCKHVTCDNDRVCRNGQCVKKTNYIPIILLVVAILVFAAVVFITLHN